MLPAQAQKHVTVNEALARLDAAAQLRVVSSALPTPPRVGGGRRRATSCRRARPAPGPGMAGQIAVWSNGGWIFLAPKAGWRAWDESGGRAPDVRRRRTGCRTRSRSRRTAPRSTWRVLEFDHVDHAGRAPTRRSVAIPSQAQVVGVTGRVVAALAGPGLTGWRIGVAGSDNRYGSGLGIGARTPIWSG